MKDLDLDTSTQNDIIKLQLRKPRNWNWQLSTSRSSPHIALPVVQLYNSKGKLLAETHGNHPLQKSRSEILQEVVRNKSKEKNNGSGLNLDENKNVISFNLEKSKSDAGESRRRRRHMRSNSDGSFQVPVDLKRSEESLKRAIQDGYSNFISTDLINPPEDEKHKKQRRSKSLQRMEMHNGLVDDHFDNVGLVMLDNKKYRTRTSSAGTLIISEDSFEYNQNRRRRRRKGNNGGNIGVQEQGRKGITHSRTCSDIFAEEAVSTRRSRPKSLFYSRSAVFPVVEVLDENIYEKSDYLVQEPITPSNDKNMVEELKKEENFAQKVAGIRKAYALNGRFDSVFCESSPPASDSAVVVVDARPLCLVSTEGDDVGPQPLKKMGANVSRHSSKGLSGRRSRSSGSICNGKQTNGSDQKMCGSLPSYLEDGGGCNNNHQKGDEDPRIPPLGDGAPLHWKFSDTQTALCDQGYGSERSPEEEYPPPLPERDECHIHLEPHACYPFITPESTFVVSLSKGSRGLGLSVTGGVDSVGSWPGLIRVKRLFPHQLAAACGLLNVGDILLEANGIPLTGLTNYEAVEVLRTTPNQVELRVCRPPPDVLNSISEASEVPPPPPRRDVPSSLGMASSIYSTTPPEDDSYHGEFEVTLTKIQGSLGFTLRKEDDSALGHYVRALVREPALTDGRIRAGDKIIAVNGVEISSMSHEQAVQFLRQCGDVVLLRLYRDASQTPVAALSPTETTPRTSFTRKAHLRQEAVDMLNDIAVRKLLPENLEGSPSPVASPRRLRRHPCNASQIDTSSNCTLSDDQFHEGLLQRCPVPFDDESFNSLFTVDDSDEYDGRPSRPNSLDLYNPNQTPVAVRKPRFNFSLAHNAYELNNLDPEVLDAPNLAYNLGAEEANSTEAECGDSFPQEPASMPYIPVESSGFSYKNPAYQTAHPNCSRVAGEDGVVVEEKKERVEDSNMKKWKGVVLVPEEVQKAKKENEEIAMLQNDCEILTIELTRGWNSRLGFSLQGAAGYTYVSAVYPDSVAAKDGRLKPGDRLITVNDESVEKMTTSDIIDLLRIVRGPVCIVVSRRKSKDCKKSDAVN